MGTTVISQYIHRPNSTELGLGNTHETYLLVGTNFDLSSIFSPGVDVNVIDSRSGKTYALKSTSGSEFRINQMGPIYKDYQVAPGDEIAFTAIKRGKTTHIFFTVNKFERVIFYVDKKGVEINNIERLEAYSVGEREYKVNYIKRGNTIEAVIKFKEAKKKRSDSPSETDFYTVSLNGTPISAGTHYLTLGDPFTLATFPKSTFNSIEIKDDDYSDENSEILSGGHLSDNHTQHNPNDELNHVIIDIIDDDYSCKTIDDLKAILNGSSEILQKFSTKGASNADSANFALLKYYKLFKKLGLNSKKDAENLLIETNLYPQSGSGSGVSPLLNILNYLYESDFFGVRYYETKEITAGAPTFKHGSNKLQQTIYFGSPGTGKSHNIKDILLKSGIDEEKGINTERLFRTTFHPDTDYSSFVGCYKPVCEHNSPTIKDIAELQLEAQALMTEIAKKPRAKVEMLSSFMKDNAESLLKAENDANGWTPLLNLIFSTGYVSSDSYFHCLCKIVAEMREQHSSSITYKFTPQVFTQAYIEAWKLWEDAGKTANEKQVFLIIEEINRGNCAQVFGDLFQLLDRKDTGYSEYNVKAEIDLAQYLESILKKGHNGIKDGNLCLPPNLNILATMNTSDQSLFPMDSAFKRRWEWQYVPTKVSPNPKDTTTLTTKVYIKDTIEGKDNILINYDFKNRTIDFGDHEYAWSDFLKAINRRIREATKSDDKLLGYWFVKGDTNGNISISTFVSKVIFYLWNDVFKEYGARDMNPFCITAIDEQSKQTYKTTMSFNQFFDENTGNINIGVVHTFMGNIGLIPDVNKEIKKVQDENQSREGAPRDIENK